MHQANTEGLVWTAAKISVNLGFFLLVTRCCQQFAHIFCLRRYYCIADVCSTQNYSDEVTAKLYSKNCFVCCSSPEHEAPLDHFIVQHLTPDINPDANDRRIRVFLRLLIVLLERRD